MRIQTFSIVAGSEACNARCPFCISRMTPDYELDLREPEVNWRNFDIACRFAKDSGVSTVLVTGKGEPTLFPDQITSFLEHLQPHAFPFVELQTNGIILAESPPRAIERWYELGLTLVAVSIVHFDAEKNRAIFRPTKERYFDLAGLVQDLHHAGLSVRLSCSMVREIIDGVQGVLELVHYARDHAVEQATVRSIELPATSRDPVAANWVRAHRPPPEVIFEIRDHLDEHGTRLMELAHGAIVYDLKGQNICLGNCLTINAADERMRQLIFFPDGHLRYDWQYEGAVLL